MKHKNLFKILFDIVMVVLFSLMYNTRVSGVTFHEIAGLVLFGLFLIHIAYNRKWVIGVSKRLFSKGYSTKQRIMYGLNVLLLVSFVMVGISGVKISHVLFVSAQKASGNWLIIHVASALCAIFLTAIHLGLHWKFILGVMKKYIKIPAKPKAILASIFVFTIIAIGAYGTITIVPSLTEQMLSHQGGFGGGGEHSNEFAGTERNASGQRGESGLEHAPKDGEVKNPDMQNDDMAADRAVNRAGFRGESINIARLCTAGGLLLAMTLLFSLVTYGIEKVLTRKK